MARKKVTLTAQLTTKAGELAQKRDAQATAAEQFIAASHKASQDAQIAETQRVAVEQATAILEEAGVNL